jgi:hypothetical protein
MAASDFLPGVERIPKHDGRTSLRVRDRVRRTHRGRTPVRPARGGGAQHHAGEIQLAEELDRAFPGGDPQHPLYRQYRSGLESLARAG